METKSESTEAVYVVTLNVGHSVEVRVRAEDEAHAVIYAEKNCQNLDDGSYSDPERRISGEPTRIHGSEIIKAINAYRFRRLERR